MQAVFQKQGHKLWEVAGIVECPPERLADLLLDVRPGQFSVRDAPLILAETDLLNRTGTLAVSGGPAYFKVALGAEATTVFLAVDREKRAVTVQGQWWYRGQYRVEAAPQGSRLSLEVYNVAPGLSRLLVPFVARGVRNQQPQSLERLLNAIGNRLHCNVYLVEE